MVPVYFARMQGPTDVFDREREQSCHDDSRNERWRQERRASVSALIPKELKTFDSECHGASCCGEATPRVTPDSHRSMIELGQIVAVSDLHGPTASCDSRPILRDRAHRGPSQLGSFKCPNFV